MIYKSFGMLFLTSLILAVVGTRFSIWLAPKISAVDKPDHRKVHAGGMPRIGGVGVVLGWIASMVILCCYLQREISDLFGVWLCGAIATFVLGLIDDKYNLRARYKFLAQFAIAGILIAFGLQINPHALPLIMGLPPLFFWVLTFFWIVGVSNAINLIDGLDGLAGGLCLIAAATLSAIAISLGDWVFLTLSLPLVAALLGFLYFNRHPARTFMGDCGSLFLGYQMATLPLLLPLQQIHYGFVVPILLLGIPIYDTVFAMARRVLVRRRPFKADREHIHHRLLALKLSHAQVVHRLYGGGMLLALIAFLFAVSPSRQQIGLLFFAVFLVYRAIRRLGYAQEILRFRHVLRTRWYRLHYRHNGVKPKTKASQIFLFLSNNKWIQVALDLVLMLGVWLAAVEILHRQWTISTQIALGLHIALSLAAFFYLHCYSDLARYLELSTASKYIKATLLSGLGVYVLITLIPGCGDIGVRLCLLTTLGFLMSTLLSRLSQNFYFRFVKRQIQNLKRGPKVLIYGAGDTGSLLLHLLMERDDLNFQVCGFIDDDVQKHGRFVAGYQVLGSASEIDRIYAEQHFDILLFSTTNLPTTRQMDLQVASYRHGFAVMQMKHHFDPFYNYPAQMSPADLRDFYL